MSEKKLKAPQELINNTAKRWHSLIDSPVGHLYLAASTKALTGLWYEEQTHFPIPDELGEFIPDPSAIAANSEPAPAASILKHTTRELQEYFAGKRTTFTIPLAPEGTDFQLMVWEYLCSVPYGYTTTYGTISHAVGPGAPAQAVGQAVGHNKISIIIPCHRVLGSNGKLTGYAGGLDRKQFLLDLEEPAEIREGRLF